MKRVLIIALVNLVLLSCSNRSDSTGTTVDSTAIKAAADSATKIANDAAAAIDSTVQAALDSAAKDSLNK